MGEKVLSGSVSFIHDDFHVDGLSRCQCRGVCTCVYLGHISWGFGFETTPPPPPKKKKLNK